MTAVCASAGCSEPAEPLAPVALCGPHLLAAHDWVTRGSGVTDLLPSPCLACGSRLGVHYPSGWLCAICEWRLGEIPDEVGVEPRVDVVYYIRFTDRIKIGTSANPRRRLESLPHDEVLAFERGGRSLEQRRHAEFAAFRIPRTEWFESNVALTAHVGAIAVGDPWECYALWVSQAVSRR